MTREIKASKLKDWIDDDRDVQIIDVREPYEFEEDHIEGAKLIPLGQIQTRLNEIDKDNPVVFICRSGSRSRMATQFANLNGYDAYNLSGGMLDWR